tara:strand:- start:1413 stop:1628 length:216 start_codon:yes stop_codon:yes gene_type:complete
MNNWDENLPLETEKYLCKLHRLNAYDLLKLEKQKEVELGLADANENYDLSFDIESDLSWIRIVLLTRSKLN